MKILHIIDHLGLGGAQTIVQGILDSQKDNHNVYCVSLRKKDVEIVIDHPNIFINPSISKYSFYCKQVQDIIDREGITILHCHLPKSFLIGFWMKLKNKHLKLIFHEHGNIYTGAWYYRLLINLSKSYVDVYLAVSHAVEVWLLEKTMVAKEKIFVLYNFVDVEKFSHNAINSQMISLERSKYGLTDKDFVIGLAGRLVKRKGWRDFIDAIDILQKQEKKIKYVIAGDGEDENKMCLLIKEKKLGDVVLYIGRSQNIPLFLSILDVFVVPSHWEPFGMIILEANAMQIPLIASNIPGIDEIVEPSITGILTEPHNPQMLAEKILYAYHNQDVMRMYADTAYQRVHQYGLDQYMKKLGSCYNNFLC
jgi:glycosyltransferase involved in cell wall biosynthesis